MASNERRRHYRVANREASQSEREARRVFKKRKRKYLAYALAFSVVTFIKGLLIGYWLAKD